MMKKKYRFFDPFTGEAPLKEKCMLQSVMILEKCPKFEPQCGGSYLNFGNLTADSDSAGWNTSQHEV